MSKQQTFSRFAEALKSLIDGGRYSRRDWATILNVKRPAITQWLRDKTIPTPHNLRAIVEIYEESSGTDRDALAEFRSLMLLPAEPLSPHGRRFGRTVGDYFVRPVFEAFYNAYERAPYPLKERAVRVAGDVCAYPDKPHLDYLWPDLNGFAANDLREIISGISKVPEARQRQFVDLVRAEYFARILRRPDPVRLAQLRGQTHSGVHDNGFELNDSLANAAVATLTHAPALYVSLLPTYTRAVRALGDYQGAEVSRWADLLTIALDTTFEQAPQQEKTQAVTDLSKALQDVLLEDLGTATALRHYVLRAYSRCIFSPPSHALDIDRVYWSHRIRSDTPIQDTPEYSAEDVLVQSAQEVWDIIIDAVADSGDYTQYGQDELRMNGSPYTEYVWQVLLRLLVNRVTKMRLVLRPVAWHGVHLELSESQIDVAFHNESVRGHEDTSHLNLVRSKSPLLLYRWYELVVGTRRVSRLLSSHALSDAQKEKILKYSGQTWEYDQAHFESEDPEAAALLFRGAVISYPKNTDIDQALTDFLNLLPIRGEYTPVPDRRGDLIGALLDGEVDAILGGNNDARYLSTHFSEHVQGIVNIDRSLDLSEDTVSNERTAVFLYHQAESPRAHDAQALARLWPWVHRIWNLLTSSGEPLDRLEADLRTRLDGLELSTWRNELQRHLLDQMNGRLCSPDVKSPGFLESFEVIEGILSKHNGWGPGASTLGFETHIKSHGMEAKL